MGGKRMPQGMHTPLFLNPRLLVILLNPVAYRPLIHRGCVPGEEYMVILKAWSSYLQIRFEGFKRLSNQGYNAILAPFPLPDRQLFGFEAQWLSEK